MAWFEQEYEIAEEITTKKQKKEVLEVYTKDGSVDRHGQQADRGRTGSWVSGILILGMFQTFTSLARILTFP